MIVQPSTRAVLLTAALISTIPSACVRGRAQDPVPAREAAATPDMAPYVERISGTDVSFRMVPIPAGTLVMGSPEDEADRKDHEGPQRRVKVSAFWIGACEVTWNEYEQWAYSLERERRPGDRKPENEHDVAADAVTRPTPPYTDMTFDMGRDGYPAICMTQLAAKKYCEWLSRKTGHFYRLPTEAEWEYACRAGTTTAYSFGDDATALDEHAWFEDNCDDQYQKVGQKKPNPWGLFDMHGNVAEWVLDAFAPYEPAKDGGVLVDPLVRPDPEEEYGRVVRGGSWFDPPERLRAAARVASELAWKEQDPQIPQSIWYLTDADWVGFRVVRPLDEPADAVRRTYWDN